MELNFNSNLAISYKSPSQKARVLTENWVSKYIFCPNCGQFEVKQYPNNEPVADFYCSKCLETFELKSKKGSLGTKIVDGAYSSMMERLICYNNPNLFLLNYDALKVINFLVVPKHFFVPEIIEKRKPLSKLARRAGWVGCNILVKNIPQSGVIYLIRESKIEPKEKVLTEWKKTLFLRNEQTETRGWLLDIMRYIDKLHKNAFTLDDVYNYENELAKLHPNNKHVKDKIRQQLQFLRDKGYLKFVSRGSYRLA